jgi:hypothetical protein
MGKRVKNKPCYWCGSLDNENNRVTKSEDVPPRWLSGIKKVKKENCVPQCNSCKNYLAMLDDSANWYFKYGANVDVEKVIQANFFSNNKGIGARKIDLNGKIDFAQANAALLLWLRKLLVGLWYKEKDDRFDGGMYILAPWLTFDDLNFYVSKMVIPSSLSWPLLLDIDDFFGVNHNIDNTIKIPFEYAFIQSSRIKLPSPLQLLRFAIYENYCGYCLFFPKIDKGNHQAVLPFDRYPPLYIDKWLLGPQYFPSSFVVELENSLKPITSEEAAKRVRF